MINKPHAVKVCLWALVLGCGLALKPSASGAAPISFNLLILEADTPGSTVDPIRLNISLSFDNAAAFPDTTTGLTVVSQNFPVDGEIRYRYFQPLDLLIVGGSLLGTATVDGAANDFYFRILNISSQPTFDGAEYSEAGTPGATFIPRANGSLVVPEPGTLGLLGAGMLGAVTARRRIRRKRV